MKEAAKLELRHEDINRARKLESKSGLQKTEGQGGRQTEFISQSQMKKRTEQMLKYKNLPTTAKKIKSRK